MNDCNVEKLKKVVTRLDIINKFLIEGIDVIRACMNTGLVISLQFESEDENSPLYTDIMDALQVERERLEKEIKKYANL